MSKVTMDPEGEVEIEELPLDHEDLINKETPADSETNKAVDEGQDDIRSDDATAVAKVYEYPVPNYVHPETDQNKTSQGNDTDTSTKPVRIKVACLGAPGNNISVVTSSSDEEDVVIRENEGENYGYNETESLPMGPAVQIVNITKLLHEILYVNPAVRTRTTPSNCSVVLFYVPWCPFCARTAPHYNALPRAFPTIKMVAIDSSSYSTVNAYFGVLSAPTVAFFHNGKLIAKFNETSFTLNKFADFIQAFSDLESVEKINVTSQDFQGPLPSVPKKERDSYLVLSWVFIVCCFLYYVSRSVIYRRVVDLIRTTWREAAQHEHVD